MNLSLRTRLTLSFSGLFSLLLIPFLGVVFYFLSFALKADLKKQMVHDYSQIMLVFSENPAWDLSLKALYREEADEFNIQIRLLDKEGKPVFRSYGLESGDFSVDNDALVAASEEADWSEGMLNGIPHLILTQMFFPKDREPHYCQIWKSKKDINRIWRRFLLIILLGLPFVLILAFFIGSFFSRRALRPVETIRQKADEIESDNLSARLPYPANRDELYRLTETLNRLLERIERSFEGMKRFTADASHELRIPLTNLQGTIEVALQKKRTAEEYRNDLESAREEVFRLGDLVRSLLALAKIDANKQVLNRTEVDLKDIMSDVLFSAQEIARKNNIGLIMGSVPDKKVFVDADKIQQLLLILIDNGIQYNRAEGTVTLSAEEKEQGVVVSVADTGEGIPPDEQGKIFERFYQVDKSRSRGGGGTGLGLSIARSIAQAHQGTLTVESYPGQGSTFRLFLPCLPPLS